MVGVMIVLIRDLRLETRRNREDCDGDSTAAQGSMGAGENGRMGARDIKQQVHMECIGPKLRLGCWTPQIKLTLLGG